MSLVSSDVGGVTENFGQRRESASDITRSDSGAAGGNVRDEASRSTENGVGNDEDRAQSNAASPFLSSRARDAVGVASVTSRCATDVVTPVEPLISAACTGVAAGSDVTSARDDYDDAFDDDSDGGGRSEALLPVSSIAEVVRGYFADPRPWAGARCIVAPVVCRMTPDMALAEEAADGCVRKLVQNGVLPQGLRCCPVGDVGDRDPDSLWTLVVQVCSQLPCACMFGIARSGRLRALLRSWSVESLLSHWAHAACCLRALGRRPEPGCSLCRGRARESLAQRDCANFCSLCALLSRTISAVLHDPDFRVVQIALEVRCGQCRDACVSYSDGQTADGYAIGAIDVGDPDASDVDLCDLTTFRAIAARVNVVDVGGISVSFFWLLARMHTLWFAGCPDCLHCGFANCVVPCGQCWC